MYRTSWLKALSDREGHCRRLAAHDLVYQSPPRTGLEAWPLGNGSLSALLWHGERSTEIHFNHSDAIMPGQGGEFRAWSWEGEEKAPAPVSPGHLRIESCLPSFDANYLRHYHGRLALSTATLGVRSATPFDSMELTALAAADPAVMLIDCSFSSAEAVERQITLERWGTRVASHFYEQQVDDPAVGLAGTESGAGNGAESGQTVTGTVEGWVRQMLGDRAVVLAVTVEAAEVRCEQLHSHAVRWTLPAATHHQCIIRISAAIGPVRADPPGDEPLAQTRRELAAALANPGQLVDDHRQRWRDFWERSAVHLADDYLENLFHLHFYSLNCCGTGRFPTLFTGAGWTWNGDIRNWTHLYHWNQQQLYWAVHAAGHPELAENYLELRWRQLPVARADARRLFGSEGAWFSDVASLEGEQAVEPDIIRNLTVGAQISQLFLLHGRHRRGQDPADTFMAERAAPFIRACARLYQDLLEVQADGHARLKGGTSPYESYLNLAESLTDHAAIRGLCAMLDELECLQPGGQPPDDLRALLPLLPPWPVSTTLASPSGESPVPLLSAGIRHDGQAMAFAEGSYPDSPFPATLLAPVFPFDCLNLPESGPDLNQLARDTLRHFMDSNVHQHGPLGCSGHTPVIQAAARLGLAEDAWAIAGRFAERYQHFPNGFMHYSARDDQHLMGSERIRVRMLSGKETSTEYAALHEKSRGERRWLDARRFVHPYYESSANLVSGIQEMLLQEHRGVLRVFAGLPATVDAGFRLLSPDAVEVMAERRGGEIRWIALRRTTGGPVTIRLELPWPAGTTLAALRGGLAGSPPPPTKENLMEQEVGPEILVLFLARDNPENAYQEEWFGGPNPAPKQYRGVRLGLERDF